MRGTKLYVMLVAMFMAGAFLASPELRAYAANTIRSTDIVDGQVMTADLANNAVTSAKIKDGEVKTDDIAPSAIGSLRIKDNDVKAQDIATSAVGADEIGSDAVGASELQGVDKLIFADCNVPAQTAIKAGPGASTRHSCPVAGADPDDEVIATKSNFDCFVLQSADITGTSGTVELVFTNTCPFSASRGAGHVSIIVYDELPDKFIPPILP
jgi:hypothetical protein